MVVLIIFKKIIIIICLISTFQSWNRHRPLPPIPTPISHSSNPNLESYKVSQLPPSQSVGLTDPYYSLSAEAQAFTNSLTSMGFLRARVARAVAKFGQDEKEVFIPVNGIGYLYL